VSRIRESSVVDAVCGANRPAAWAICPGRSLSAGGICGRYSCHMKSLEIPNSRSIAQNPRVLEQCHVCYTYTIRVIFFSFLLKLEFELRVSLLLGRHSIA
jgi:hypothetical protein